MFRKIRDLEPVTLPWSTNPGCSHPEHDFPTHIYLEPGVYENECPACGKRTTVTVPLRIC